MASVVATLQDRLAFLLSCGAHASAEVLAQGLLIEAPATTATATAQSSPQVGPGSPVRTLALLADALKEQGEHPRAVQVYRQALQLLARHRPSGQAKPAGGDSTGNSANNSVSESSGLTADVAAANDIHASLSVCLHRTGDTRGAIESLERIPLSARSVAVHLRLGRMHLLLDHSAEHARASFARAWRASSGFALEAARALIDLGQHRADGLLAMCPARVHFACAPWIPTLIQAYAYERHYAPRDALKCLESLGAAFDTSLDCLLQKARLRLQLLDLSAAIQLYERAHRLDEHNCTDMDLYAMCLFERRGPSDLAKLNALAQQLTTNASGVSSGGAMGRPEPWIAAALHALMGADGRADALADQAVRSGPRHANAHFVKGMVLIAIDNPGASLPCFRKAMKLEPSIRTYTGMVHAYIADGQHVMALGTAKEVQKKMPGEAQPLVLLGTAYAAQCNNINGGGGGGGGSREMKRAKLAFHRALKLDPACEIATHKLVDLLFASYDNEAAVEVLKSALRHNESARLHARMGQALSGLTAGQAGADGVMHFHAAAEHFQQALGLDPRNGDALRGQEKLEALMKGEDPDKSMDQGDEEEDF